jgi:hypothetical protein
MTMAIQSYTEWSATIPDQVDARAGQVLIAEALADAKQATDDVIARYSGGTLPPPPWPQHALLQQAIAALEGGAKLLHQAIDMGYGDRKEPKSGPLGTRLQNGGRALYREIDVMRKAHEGVKLEDLPGIAARLAMKAAAPKLGGLLTFAAVMWVLHNLEDA